MLNDRQIRDAIKSGRIGFSGYDRLRVQPNSIDLCLGDKFFAYDETYRHLILDPRRDLRPYFVETAGIIKPKQLVIARTRESIHVPNDLVGQVHGKSSLGRLGLGVHVTAGLCDSGWGGTVTLELTNDAPYPILLIPGMPICQMTFEECEPVESSYSGKYSDQIDPTLSRYHENWDDERGAWK